MYLSQVEGSNINVNQKSAVPAFELYGKNDELSGSRDSIDSFEEGEDVSQQNDRYSVSNSTFSNDYNYKHNEIYSKNCNKQTIFSNDNLLIEQDSFNLNGNNNEIYYSIEEYNDKVGDGLNIKKGQKFMVHRFKYK